MSIQKVIEIKLLHMKKDSKFLFDKLANIIQKKLFAQEQKMKQFFCGEEKGIPHRKRKGQH